MTTVTSGTTVPRSDPGPAAAIQMKPRRILERAGRRLVQSAIARVLHGGIRVHDSRGSLEFESPGASSAGATATIRVLDDSFYSAAAFGGSLGVAESYMDGAWESEDLAGLIEIITTNLSAMESLDGPLTRMLAPVSRAAYWLERNSRAGSRRNIRAHYDLGNEFFELFLDPTMSYSCAVFENGAATLEDAQKEKIDRACRKLGLRPEHHLLEIGTGWGALAIHAATRYGCRVTTTTISDRQHELATLRVTRAGLQERVTVIKADYRDLPRLFPRPFDRLVSIEMIEAVGRRYLSRYFDVCARCLRPDGAALIQSIVIRDQFFEGASRRRDFLKKYIFPGSCLPSLGAMLHAVNTRTDLRTWHLEDIGPHYATTLRCWHESFARRREDVRRLGFDSRFIRMWEYYLAYCEGAFRARHVGDVQWLLTKPFCRIPPAGPWAAERA